jgi:hypothetical protein
MACMTRRRFATLASLFLYRPARVCAEDVPIHRDLRFRIGKGFGDHLENEIKALLHSTADAIWQHCPDTHWQVQGFSIYYNEPYPIADYKHTEDGYISIGLATKDMYWCQYAFQFAHEFCHALIGHSNDWRAKKLGGVRPNHWLEESICEVASLFALRAMSRSWQKNPPFVNWRDYAIKLHDYAEDRITKARAFSDEPFVPWFEKSQPLLRKKSTMRDHNCRIAIELLPLFEKHPAGWEAMAFFSSEPPTADQTLEQHFARWLHHATPKHHAFIRSLAAVFALKAP